ncbi:MAG: response regulator [Deltaproteobacteria bacterium]|nr:response regulator [Deltaproteobacteria bacterium]
MGNNKKVLVVDDEAHIRRVIEVKLKKCGYQVITAINGKEGFNLIKTQKPDVVITDIMMPEMDGKTLCKKTNSLKKERPFLTIIITCRISPDEESWTDGMQDTLFMEKPFSPARLVEYIDQYFGGPSE